MTVMQSLEHSDVLFAHLRPNVAAACTGVEATATARLSDKQNMLSGLGMRIVSWKMYRDVVNVE